MSEYRIKNLIEDIQNSLVLKLLSSKETLENTINTPELIQPGLALAGYFEHFLPNRIQILARTEVSYLKNISEDKLTKHLDFFQDYNIPCFILTGGMTIPDETLASFNKANIAVLNSDADLDRTVIVLSGFLHDKFAETASLHGVLMDVYSVGILLCGASGIGKSECALDLIERRHRLVADDLVIAKKIGGVIIGGSLDGPLKFHLEVRGVGIINVKKLFGIRSVNNKKRINIVVELVEPAAALEDDRSGLTRNYYEILGLKLPLIRLPISSVSNIAKTLEAIAMRHVGEKIEKCRLDEYNEKLIEILETKKGIKFNKEED